MKYLELLRTAQSKASEHRAYNSGNLSRNSLLQAYVATGFVLAYLLAVTASTIAVAAVI